MIENPNLDEGLFLPVWLDLLSKDAQYWFLARLRRWDEQPNSYFTALLPEISSNVFQGGPGEYLEEMLLLTVKINCRENRQ